MTDYGYIFSKDLHEKLKEKIHAGVFVRSTNDDELEILIVRKSEDFTFKVVIENFSDKLLYGYSIDYAAYQVLAKYRKFIFNRYFIDKGGTQ